MRRLVTMTLLVAAITVDAQSPAMRERLSGTVRAINGTPEEFEAYAKDAFAKTLFDKETPEQRRKLFVSIRTEYGTLTPGRAARESPTQVRLSVIGTKKSGDLMIAHEVEPPHRITSLSIEASGGDAPAQATASRAAATTEERMRDVDKYVWPLTQTGTFSGVVLVARDGVPVFQKGYGLADREKNVANTADTRLNVGSINKQLTRVALAQLAAAGKLSLDDPVEKHLPDYPNVDGRRTTIRQLVTHQGGVADWYDDGDFVRGPKSRFRSNRDFYRIVASKPLRFSPGSKTEYCNACFVVLGEIIERIAGMSYERVAQERVLTPAGMADSGFFQIDRPQPRMAIGYTRDGARGLVPNVTRRGAGGNAAGGAFMTAKDLLAFEQAIRGRRLMDEKWTAWFLDNRPQIFFGGGGDGVSAALLGDGRWTVVAMANLDTPAGSSVAKALFSMLTRDPA
jgi:D-alanyl-D-alanine carboxypeptidase